MENQVRTPVEYLQYLRRLPGLTIVRLSLMAALLVWNEWCCAVTGTRRSPSSSVLRPRDLEEEEGEGYNC